MAIPPLSPGTLLRPEMDGEHRYEVETTLGAGGFGVTYRVVDKRLGGHVVIKELVPSATGYRNEETGRIKCLPGKEDDQQKQLDRFVREARRLNMIRSPNVVRVIDVWEENGTAYYAMDEIGGGTLESLGRMSWPEAEPIAIGVLAALEAVHAQDLVHADVKPENVLVDADRVPVLIDFGTARSDQELDKTSATSVMFSTGYAPFELMHPGKSREIGPWTDLYSWAMLVWSLVLEHHGEDNRPTSAFERMHDEDPYWTAAAQLIAVGVPANWANLLHGCFDPDGSGRPQSVAEVRNTLALPVPNRTGALPQTPTRPPSVARTTPQRMPNAANPTAPSQHSATATEPNALVASVSASQASSASVDPASRFASVVDTTMTKFAGMPRWAQAAVVLVILVPVLIALVSGGSDEDDRSGSDGTDELAVDDPGGVASTGDHDDGPRLDPMAGISEAVLADEATIITTRGYARLYMMPSTDSEVMHRPDDGTVVQTGEVQCGDDGGRFTRAIVPYGDDETREGWLRLQDLSPNVNGCCAGRRYDCGAQTIEALTEYTVLSTGEMEVRIDENRVNMRTSPVSHDDADNWLARTRRREVALLRREVCTPDGIVWAEILYDGETGWVEREDLSPQGESCCLGRAEYDRHCETAE